MGFAALAAVVAVFDVLLRVVPCTTSIAEVVGHQLADEDDCGEERTERLPVDAEADDNRREHCEKCRRGEFAQRGLGADVDDRAVVGLLGTGHDAAVCELVAHFLHDDTGRAANRADREGGEEERHRTTDEEADEDLRLGDVDREFRQLEHAVGEVLHAVDERFTHLVLDARTGDFDERCEQGDGCDDGRTDGEALGDGLRGVTHGVECDHDLLGLTVEFARHLGDTRGVVGDGTEGVFRDDDASGCQHAHAREGHEVEAEGQVAATESDGHADRDCNRNHCVHRGLEARCGSGQDDRCRTGFCRLRDLLDGAVVGARVVLGEAAHQLRKNETDGNRAEDAPSCIAERHDLAIGVFTHELVVADVGESEDERADERQDTGHEEAAVDGLQGIGFIRLGLHGEHARDRGNDADGACGEREDETEGRVQADGVERGHTEDDRGDEGHLVAFEEVGGHAGAVTHVVAHVVGDGGGVARVVFGDARFDLANEVGANVGGLREDTAAHAQEKREERATEAESDEDHRRGVLKQHDDDGCTEKSEANGEHARDTARAEGDGESAGHRVAESRGRGTNVAARGQGHTDVPGETRGETAQHERDRAVDAGLGERKRRRLVGLQDLGRGHEDDDDERDENEADRLELALQVGPCAFLDRRGDLDHLRRAFTLGHDLLDEEEADA